MSSALPGRLADHRRLRGADHLPAGRRRPISPLPRFAWRSAPVPGGSRESLACSRSIRPTIASTRSTASDSSSPAAWAWQVSKQKPIVDVGLGARTTASHRPREGVESARHGVVSAGGVLDVEGNLALEHARASAPSGRSRLDPVLRVSGMDDHRGGPDLGGRLAGLLEDLARAVADVVLRASRR